LGKTTNSVDSVLICVTFRTRFRGARNNISPGHVCTKLHHCRNERWMNSMTCNWKNCTKRLCV